RDVGFRSNSQTTQGFKITTSNNCTIRDCYFDSGLQRMGILIGPGTRNITVESNVSDGTTLAENIAFVDCSYCSLLSNDIKQPTTSNSHNGIELFIITAGSMVGNKVIGNSFKNLGAAGVGLGGDNQTIVSGNTMESCTYGISAGANNGSAPTGAAIVGNTIKS